jgi:hypothetical protein
MFMDQNRVEAIDHSEADGNPLKGQPVPTTDASDVVDEDPLDQIPQGLREAFYIFLEKNDFSDGDEPSLPALVTHFLSSQKQPGHG